MTAPYDPPLMQDLRVEGIRYLRVSRRTWSFSPVENDGWKIVVRQGGRSHQMITVYRYRWGWTPHVERQIAIPTAESFRYSLALAKNLNGNIDKPDLPRRG